MTTRLPKLRPVDYGRPGVVTRYKLSDSDEKRHKAINTGIRASTKIYGSQRITAIKKKARFNILRIYRRYLKKGECQKITKDMRYIKNGTTKNIC
tara:strand:- start:242 stop:526 length:285 start_codon:yes stop_codon:yes gene_type:complete